ncbi:MAG TPA: shikimate kinase [Candidatus Polarisedimenticolia bacterium]|nr:shikimate kinase [Candidatus Polarisedimenticolia bacterium]
MEKGKRGRIYLVGFMGSGKTTVGAALARELGYRLIDLDREIEKQRGLSVSEIFEKEGEPAFRQMEAGILRSTEHARDVVVATGGGTMTRWENREFIARTGVTVWLDAPLEVLLERCRGGERRPLLSTPERMAALLEERLVGYKTADLRADTAGRSPEAVARWIAGQAASHL